MEEILLLIRILLAGVFVLAGVGKLFDPAGSAKAVRDFGVPEEFSAGIGYALPVAEILIAVLLLFPSTSWFGAIGATLLLAAFVGGMLWQYSHGNAPECHCFGQMHSEPVGPKSIGRNVVLLSLALLGVIAGRSFQGPPLAGTREGLIQTLTLFGLAVAAIIGISYLKRLLGSQAEIARRIELLELLSTADVPKERQEAGNPNDGLPLGALFPSFELKDRAGTRWSLTGFLNAGPILFFFVGPGCSPCKSLMPEIEGWHASLSGKVEVVVITSGTPQENSEKLRIAEGIPVLFDEGREVAQSVYAKWTPSALLVRADGRVASHVAVGDTAIRDLVSKLESANTRDRFLFITNGNNAPKPKIGEHVPVFALESVDGKKVTNLDLVGRQTLAVFWSQTCPHCVAMMSELKEWDHTKGADDPALIVFSDGDKLEHAELGLHSPIVLESGYKTANSLGMQGTPSGVLIDENGYIVSEPGIGAPNIWALIGRK
jgi:thiol-disulfide isomerase/thioredoxin/uncharacterized membrane protein YphA (DoxX/SURF4 family)